MDLCESAGCGIKKYVTGSYGATNFYWCQSLIFNISLLSFFKLLYYYHLIPA